MVAAHFNARPSRALQPRQRGAVAIMVAISMLMLLALVGLVIDGGLAYLVKARLNAAVDSAAVAAARAVPVGNNQTEQTASAQAAAANFFAANIPANYLMSKPTLISTTVTFNVGMVTIDVRAEAPMPVSVMQVMGFTSLTPVAYAQTIRKDLDMAMVIDDSGSLSSKGATVRASAKTFLNKFNVTQDRVALIHFGTGGEVDDPIRTTGRGFDRASMTSHIDNLAFKGNTDSVEGMWHGRNQLNSIAAVNRSSLRVIVFFSDGEPTSFASRFDFLSGGCTTPGVLVVSGTNQTGLMDPTKSSATPLPQNCSLPVGKKIWSTVDHLPDFYNAHDDKKEFPIVTNSPRVVTAGMTNDAEARLNLERVTRNLPEAVAAKARDEGIYIFTLGLGDELKLKYGVDQEVNETILKCMANVADGPARCYNPAKPVGMYCFAATEADLTPCFSKLASAILRISK
jgi:Flp pilus assembly protein TadG